jgi:hypothetical protein
MTREIQNMDRDSKKGVFSVIEAYIRDYKNQEACSS